MKLKTRLNLVFLTIITLAVFGLSYTLISREYKASNKDYESSKIRTMKLLSLTNTKNIWNYDFDGIKQNIVSFLDDSKLVSIKLEVGSEVIEQKNANNDKIDPKFFQEEIQPILDEEGKEIGNLKVVFTNYHIVKNLVHSRNIILGIYIIIIIFSSIFVYLFSGSFTKPIFKLINQFNRISEGDLHVSLEIHSKDEIEMLANSFNTFSTKLNHTLINVKKITEKVEESNEELVKRLANLIYGKEYEYDVPNKLNDGIVQLRKSMEIMLEIKRLLQKKVWPLRKKYLKLVKGLKQLSMKYLLLLIIQ